MKRTEAESTGLRIRQARARKGFNQKEFADKLGIQATWLSRLERNRGRASDELLLKIAEETGTTFSWLTLQDYKSNVIFSDSPRTQEEQLTIFKNCLSVIMSDYYRKLHLTSTIISEDFPYWKKVHEISIENCPLSKWILDLSLFMGGEHFWRVNWNDTFYPFLCNIVLSKEERDSIKYTFVVPNDSLYNAAPKEIQVAIGNVSVLQLDMEKKQVVRERYFSTAPSRASRKYLEEELCFPDTANPTTAE